MKDLRFWKRPTPVVAPPEPLHEDSKNESSEPLHEDSKNESSEPLHERGYFETVATADIIVRNIARQDTSVVGPETAMRLATVYRCISILSGSIASLPLRLKRKKNGVFMVDEDNTMNYLLTKCPNGRQTAYELIRNAVIQMVNDGNAYIYPDWIMGELRSLVLLSPGSVSYDKMINLYLVNDPINNVYKTLECDEIIHLRNMSLDGGYTGVSTIRYAASVMGIAASANLRCSDNFQPGSTYKGFISGDPEQTQGYESYTENQLKDASDRFRRDLRSEPISYLPGNLRFNQLSMSPVDIQLLESMKASVLEICRFYGVHPDKAFAGQSQNYKASEMSQVSFMTDTLQPLLRQIESEFYAKLIPREVASKYRIEFDIESFYQTDLETISTYNEKKIQNGLATVNELRAKEGKAPVEGGDVTMISCNVTPITDPTIKSDSVKKSKKGELEGENNIEVPPK